ncbi:hypothetical protein E0Z10_g10729 [Xylaria hypoxylon]|uniref:Integral membrane protein n=1 Tax=Xylaria hypoxylon TaxID=37992 RepID=A0A4Z0Y0Y4_9PEZI|nr:hypothetical protein E0Z10_g10729 [Xylaria hypoxylon]
MSYWSHTSSGAAENPPPLPPRNYSYGPIAIPDELPPPIPPRPSAVASAGIQRKAIPSTGVQAPTSPAQNGRTIISGQSMTPGYSDISHLFPGGKIPPPPPMSTHSGVGSSSQTPSSTSRPDTSVSTTVSQPHIPSSLGTYTHGNQLPNETQQYTSGGSRQRTDSMNNYTTNTNTHDVDKNLGGQSDITQGVAHPAANDDMAAMNGTFQAMRLANPNEETRARSPRQSSNPAPHILENVPLIQKSPGARPPSPDASAPSQSMPKECISTGVTFAYTWYTHRRAPDFPICANCHENRIRGSRFEAEFQGKFCDDGKPRGCGFGSTRIKDSLWELALSSGSLDALIEYMILRSTIPNCVGSGGVKGDAGIKWYRTRNNEIPAMVVCQACYEDHILTHPTFGVDHFEPNTFQHAADQTWSCDMVLPYNLREYKVRASTNDWQSFVLGVAARISFKPCPRDKTVYPDSRSWFTPVGGPQGLLVCVACYCDYILLTGQDGRWQNAGDNLVNIFGVSVCCYFGSQFNVRLLGARTLDTDDYTSFWKAIDIVNRSPTCKSQMQNATWYTLHSNPNGFEICQACYVTIAEPMGVGHHFMLKAGIDPGSSITCSFNPVLSRFAMYMNKLLEMVYKQDPTPLEEFIKVYAFMPICRRDNQVENTRWFGWNECTICPECHHEFIRGTALADAMPHQGIQAGGPIMCEMYSQRMRKLYLAACASDPPDPKPLLEYSMQRRAVWAETMPRVKSIMRDINLKIAQQNMAISNSSFYTFSGNLWQNSLPLERTSGSAAIGYGYHNHMQIKGAEYGQQATAIGSEILGSPAHVADELESRWRAVE